MLIIDDKAKTAPFFTKQSTAAGSTVNGGSQNVNSRNLPAPDGIRRDASVSRLLGIIIFL